MTQWCSTAVFKVCRRAGVPRDRIMAKRWVLTWKLPDDAVDAADPRRKAEARPAMSCAATRQPLLPMRC
eukprot:7485296-Alexandrium_andersonii.AAC.1